MSVWSAEAIKTILLISVPAIGDSLLATAMLASLKKAYPDADIDVLVPQECLGILEGNSCVRECIPFRRKTKILQNGPLYSRLFRKYDLAVSNSVGDRYYWYQFIAARYRAALVPEYSVRSFWKYWLLSVKALNHPTEHAVLRNGRVLEAMGIEPLYDIEAPRGEKSYAEVLEKLGIDDPGRRMALLHPRPGGEYKEWPNESWASVVRYLDNRGIRVILSGGPGDAERGFVTDIVKESGIEAVNAAGLLQFSELAALLREIDLFIGTDTSTTHLAASVGAPTLALFGPTSLKTWSPWPQNKEGVSVVSEAGAKHVFQDRPGVQKIGNVLVLSEPCRCRPYYKSCELTGSSRSECMRRLAVDSVVEQIESLLPAGVPKADLKG